MPDPVVIPSIAMLTGGGLLARDYLTRRLHSPEDRYMTLYGQEAWDGSNMDLHIHCAPHDRSQLLQNLLDRLDVRLTMGGPDASFFQEKADFKRNKIHIHRDNSVRVKDLLEPRKGAYFDLNDPSGIRLVWNHMQTDGVGMWSALKPLFDPNPPLVPYVSNGVPVPPPFVPELLALPSTARRLAWRSQLRRDLPIGPPLQRGFRRWSAEYIRDLRKNLGGPFNLLSSALTLHDVFKRHPRQRFLNVGLTAYFPFLKGRNKYGIFLCRVSRGTLSELAKQLHRQTRNQLLNWGRSAAQAYALGRLPDRLFSSLVNYYRRQVDVLISSLPVGQKPISLAGIPAQISCHPWELTLPYYFLLVGTREALDVSYTSRFGQMDSFLRYPEPPTPRAPFEPESIRPVSRSLVEPAISA